MKRNRMLMGLCAAVLLMGGCQSAAKEQSEPAANAEVQEETTVEQEEKIDDAELTEAVDAEAEEAPAEEAEGKEETQESRFDLDAIVQKMGYTAFVPNDTGEKMLGYYEAENWTKKDVEGDLTYTVSGLFDQEVFIRWSDSEAYANLPDSYIEACTMPEGDGKYFKSYTTNLVKEMTTPYGTAYLFCDDVAYIDDAVGEIKQYELAVPSVKGVTLLMSNSTFSDEESNVQNYVTIAQSLFGLAEDTTSSEGKDLAGEYSVYLQSGDVNTFGFNVPEGYEEAENDNPSSQGLIYKKDSKCIIIYQTFPGENLDTLWTDGSITYDVEERTLTEKDSMETPYGTVKLYDESTGLSGDFPNRKERAVVPYGGSYYSIMYVDYSDAYYTNPQEGDVWKGDIKGVVGEMVE